MFTELFWIDAPWRGRLAIAARPRGEDWLDDETTAWRRSGIDIVVSLLESDEAGQLGLARERESCEAAGMQFRSLPIVDRSVPGSLSDAVRLLEDIDVQLNEGRNVVVHCRQGIGRAGLMASALLVDAGLTPAEAVRRVTEARHLPVPETKEQRSWIDAFAATLQPKH
jgi:protein-tyrosine phosphatase